MGSSLFKKEDAYKILGIALILTAVFITISIRCLSRGQLYGIYLLSGVGVGLLFSKSAEKTEVTYSISKNKFVLFGSAAFSIALILINPIKWFESDDCNNSANMSINVINYDAAKSKQDIMLRGKGNIVGTTKNGISTSVEINQNGVATFQTFHIGDEVRFRIEFSEPYKNAQPNLIYKIKNDEAIYLPIELEGISSVQGRVLFNDLPLNNVNVSVGKLTSSTDSNGRYEIIIPKNQQMKSYEVWFYKKGFKTKFATVYPQTGQDLNVIMEK